MIQSVILRLVTTCIHHAGTRKITWLLSVLGKHGMTQPDLFQSSGIIGLDVAIIKLILSSQYLRFHSVLMCIQSYADIKLKDIYNYKNRYRKLPAPSLCTCFVSCFQSDEAI